MTEASHSIYNTSNTTSWTPAVKPSSTEHTSYNGRTASLQKEEFSSSVREALHQSSENTQEKQEPLLAHHRIAQGAARPQTDARVRLATTIWVKGSTPTSAPTKAGTLGIQKTDKFQERLLKNQTKLENVIKETINSEESYRNDLSDLLGYFDVSLNDPQLNADLKAFNKTLLESDPEATPLTREGLELAKKHYTEAKDSSQQMQSLMPQDNHRDASFLTGKEFMQTLNGMAQSGAGEVVLGYEKFHVNVGQFLKSQTSVKAHIKALDTQRKEEKKASGDADGVGVRSLAKLPDQLVNQPIQRIAKYQLLAREMGSAAPESRVQIQKRIDEIENTVDKLNVVNSNKDLRAAAEEITKGISKPGLWTKFNTAFKELLESKIYKQDSSFKQEVNQQANMVFRHNLNTLAEGGFFQKLSLKVDLFFGTITKQEFKSSVEYQIKFIQDTGIKGNTDDALFSKVREEVDKLTR